jgi:hypothetical protein
MTRGEDRTSLVLSPAPRFALSGPPGFGFLRRPASCMAQASLSTGSRPHLLHAVVPEGEWVNRGIT